MKIQSAVQQHERRDASVKKSKPRAQGFRRGMDKNKLADEHADFGQDAMMMHSRKGVDGKARRKRGKWKPVLQVLKETPGEVVEQSQPLNGSPIQPQHEDSGQQAQQLAKNG